MNSLLLSFFSILLLAVFQSESSIQRSRRGAYMSSSSYSRPSYEWNQQNYNPYQNWNQNQNPTPWEHNSYSGNRYGSSYGRPSSYGPPQSAYGPPKSSYGRPEPSPSSYSPYSRPTSSYGRPPQFYPQQPTPPVVPPVVPPVFSQPIVPSTPVVPVVPSPPVPVPVPIAPTDFAPTTVSPLFGGVEPGSGVLAPGEVPPPPPPTDEEMTRVDPAEKENEVRKARGGPPA
ncbi:unnamed protein product [Caenorhabditis sp. 36 PRJEB53466]|nr:unnamed protein product [Caenorhabditis sp. 36 PRJEB53466]